MSDYEQYEADCKRIRRTNQELLTEFKDWLESAGLSSKTIRNHLNNIDLYINEYLLSEDAVEAQEGVSGGNIDMFLGYWFIKVEEKLLLTLKEVQALTGLSREILRPIILGR